MRCTTWWILQRTVRIQMVNFRVHLLALKGILGLFSDPGGGRGRRASVAESPTWSEAGPLRTCPSSGLGRKRTASDTALQQRPCPCSTCLSIPLHGTSGIWPLLQRGSGFTHFCLLSSLQERQPQVLRQTSSSVQREDNSPPFPTPPTSFTNLPCLPLNP